VGLFFRDREERWTDPYAPVLRALARVSRNDPTDFTPSTSLRALRPLLEGDNVVSLRAAREQKLADARAHHPSAQPAEAR
jgi:hypothetical protein